MTVRGLNELGPHTQAHLARSVLSVDAVLHLKAHPLCFLVNYTASPFNNCNINKYIHSLQVLLAAQRLYFCHHLLLSQPQQPHKPAPSSTHLSTVILDWQHAYRAQQQPCSSCLCTTTAVERLVSGGSAVYERCLCAELVRHHHHHCLNTYMHTATGLHAQQH